MALYRSIRPRAWGTGYLDRSQLGLYTFEVHKSRPPKSLKAQRALTGQ